MFACMLQRCSASTVLVLKLFTSFMESADNVRITRGDFGRQMCRDKECHFNGESCYNRVWRKGAGERFQV